MHIHGNSMNINAANFYSVGSGERNVAAQRAADIRKRLQKGAAVPEGTPAADEASLIDHWLGARPGHSEAAAEFHSYAFGKDSDFG